MNAIFKSTRQVRTRQTAQEESNSNNARSASCNDGQSSQHSLPSASSRSRISSPPVYRTNKSRARRALPKGR